MSDRADIADPQPRGRVGTVINGKWKVDARIGAGGMATVYAATHRNGGRVALKVLHTHLSKDEGTRARFLREGYVANAVGHPGVVGVLDDGIAEDGAAFIVLELLEGETTEARRERLGGKLEIADALDIADQALDALAAAHDKGIVHRDLKPDNVFLTHAGHVKLLDFGLARMKDATAEATRTGVTIGTPEFMPPEQAVGKRGAVDERSDVWGLGATLFTLLTGEYVHDASTLHEQLLASATHRARPIRSLVPAVPPPVAQVIDRALELEKEHRWATAKEMQDAFRQARRLADRYGEDFSSDSLTVASSRDGAVSSDETVLAPREPPSSDQTQRRLSPRGFARALPHEDDETDQTERVPISGDQQRPPPSFRVAPPAPASTERDVGPATPPVSTPPRTARLSQSSPEGTPAVQTPRHGGTAMMPAYAGPHYVPGRTPGSGVPAATGDVFGETVPMNAEMIANATRAARDRSANQPHGPSSPQTLAMSIPPHTPRSAPSSRQLPNARQSPYGGPTMGGPGPSYVPTAPRTAPGTGVTTSPGVRGTTSLAGSRRTVWLVVLLVVFLVALGIVWALLRLGHLS